MGTLEDESGDVRYNALSTLEDYLLGMDEGSVSYRLIKDELIAKTSEQAVSLNVRDAINEFLKTQQEQASIVDPKNRAID
jgi:hypothetical protein